MLSSSSWGPEHACPLGAAAAVAWFTRWNPRGRAEQGSGRALVCRSCPCVSVVLEQILTRPSRTGCLYTRTLASPPSQGCVPALHPVDLLDQHTAGCKTPNGGIPVYQVPNKRSELMQFPRAEVKRDSWDTLELEVDRAKQVPHSRSRVASTAEQTSPLPTERKLATPRTHPLHHPCRCRDTEDRVSQILSIFCNYFQGGNKTGDDSKLQ